MSDKGTDRSESVFERRHELINRCLMQFGMSDCREQIKEAG